MEETEKWCKKQAVYNALVECISIHGEDSKDKDIGAITDIMQKALSVSFDNSIGHDYLEDSDARHAFYHRTEDKIPFDLKDFNRVTKGGIAKKTLTVFMGGTNVGKTLWMCHVAANALKLGKNALYITLEMAKEKIAQRIDANLLDVAVNDLETLTKDQFDSKIQKLKSRTKGKLIVQEYPPTCVGANHFRHLLNELKLKKKFVPDIIFIDYIGLAISSRLKMGNQNVNSYGFIKAISEEFRAIAVEYNVPVVTATQLNRKGYASDSPGMEDTSESFGLPMTADLFFIGITNDNLRAQKRLLIRDAKNRDNQTGSTFMVGVEYEKMRLTDVDDNQQPTTDPTKAEEIYKTVGNTSPSQLEQMADENSEPIDVRKMAADMARDAIPVFDRGSLDGLKVGDL